MSERKYFDVIDGGIDIPDELDSLFNKLGMQLRFYQFSGKSEEETLAHMTYQALKFFMDNPKLLESEELKKAINQ